ncbi:5053_t:CDS:2 [Funneliformis mosseae]|uniref:5053_t:CDS:1 n=1 Tax=Funneliformis mosseae TaxID=27381 RepID=A0A9N8YTB7_FUNMO|nr:5053_t:CDS:2 [Funneliformis mosseae]
MSPQNQSTTGQKAHRRNMSLTFGNNSSSENLIASPNNTRVDNTTYLTPIDTLTSGKKSHLNNILKDKISPLTPPSTPSKHKPYNPFTLKKKVDGNSPQSTIVDVKKVFFLLIFSGALVVFFGALTGIGIPFEGDIVSIDSDNSDHVQVIIDKNTDEFSENFETQKEEVDDLTRDTIDDDDINDGLTNAIAQDLVEEPELATDQENFDQNPALQPEPVKINENVYEQEKEENVVKDMEDNSDKIPSNNDSDTPESEDKIEQHIDEITVIPNKLQNKKNRYSENQNNENDDYSNHAYIRHEAHFTYDDVVESLTEEERADILLTKSLEINTDESLDSSCGSWQDNYSRLHENILSRNASQRYVSYICDDKIKCGGLANRILGMTSAFIFALLTNRAFLADWQTRLPLEDIFNSPNIDWSYDSLNLPSDIRELETSEINIIDFDARTLDEKFMLSNWTTKYPSSFIKFYSNRGMVIRSFDSKFYSQILKDMGLRPHTAFGCILDYLFLPVPSAYSFITQYTSLFALSSIFTVGIQIKSQNGLTSLQDYKYYFDCADQLTQTYAAPHQKVIYYVVTDSVKLREEAVEELEHVVVSGLPIDSNFDNLDNLDSANNALIENWIFSKTDYRVISPGDYGKLAAFHSKQLHTTVFMEDSHNVPDCTREKTTFPYVYRSFGGVCL